MKKLLLALTLICASAFAEEWFEMPNEAGGKIILLTAKCDTKNDGKMVIATMPSGNNIQGCWWYFADMVHVVWANGKTSSFQPNDFTARKK